MHTISALSPGEKIDVQPVDRIVQADYPSAAVYLRCLGGTADALGVWLDEDQAYALVRVISEVLDDREAAEHAENADIEEAHQ